MQANKSLVSLHVNWTLSRNLFYLAKRAGASCRFRVNVQDGLWIWPTHNRQFSSDILSQSSLGMALQQVQDLLTFPALFPFSLLLCPACPSSCWRCRRQAWQGKLGSVMFSLCLEPGKSSWKLRAFIRHMCTTDAVSANPQASPAPPKRPPECDGDAPDKESYSLITKTVQAPPAATKFAHKWSTCVHTNVLCE